MEIVDHFSFSFAVIQIVGVDPRSARMRFGKGLLNFSDIEASFEALRIVEPAVTDPSNHDIDFLEGQIRLQLLQ